jgi:aldose 1-epimerase
MLTLASGRSSIVVAPEYGAALASWMIGDTAMLRRAPPQATLDGDPHAMGCFPLLPYGNRIGHRRCHWLGVGWQRAWSVEQVTPRSAELRLQHRPDQSWPFAFSARVAYRLSDTALTITIALTNRHDTPAPAGIGIHPFLPTSCDPALRFNATGAWENGADALPFRQGPPDADWLHTEPRPVRDSRLDNCFTGWDGTADILAGPASLRIEASKVFRQVQVFTPSWADFFCVEPVSHLPDAINRPDLPAEQAMHVLQPNASLAGTVRFTATG